ncbi:TPA: hypothetical protein OUI44_000151 [Klebsiella quasipneumoniae]|nr:hypothetical protein [Klebsiella variicola]SXD56286.1 Uncharacterised protein [Klebsiella quasipneumoniae]HCU2161503.1 hypothetical protein [Klebsiella quasipneumoniae]
MDIGSLISTLSSISTLGKALIDERDRQKLASLQIDLSNKIIEAQSRAGNSGRMLRARRRFPPIQGMIGVDFIFCKPFSLNENAVG